MLELLNGKNQNEEIKEKILKFSEKIQEELEVEEIKNLLF